MQPLVLVHGWGFNGSVWDSLLPELQNHFAVTVIDLPGYRSRPKVGGMTLGEMAEDVAEQVPESAVWLGWSLGGQVSLQAALDWPDRVSKLILVGATPRFVQGGGWREAIKQKVLDDFGKALIHSRETTIGRFLTLQMLGAKMSGESRELIKKLKASLSESPMDGTLEAGLRVLNETDLCPQLGSINQPAHWIMGERDQLVPASAGELAAEQMKSGTSMVIEGAAHAPFLSHREQFIEEVIRFAR